MKKENHVLMALFVFSLAGCSHRPVVPDMTDVKVSRAAADKNCKELGNITGTSISVKSTAEQVLEDLKKEAAHKGANYVVVKQYSDNNTSVTGIAYECP